MEKRLEYESGEARRFYAGLKEPALVGIEGTGYTIWLAEMPGEAGKIRAQGTRKHKYGGRDAGRPLNLLVRGDFERIWPLSTAERDARVLPEHRHRVEERHVQAKDSLQGMEPS